MTDSIYFVSLRVITRLPLLLGGLWDGRKLAALSGLLAMWNPLGTLYKVLRDTWQTIGLNCDLLIDKGHPIAGCHVI